MIAAAVRGLLLGVLGLGLGLGTAGCYAPTPPPGAPCANGACPAGLVCAAATQTCERADADADAGPGDAADAPLPDDSAPLCFGTGLVRVCPVQPPTGALAFGLVETLDTDTSPLCRAYTGGVAGAWCVLTAATVDVTNLVTVTGSRPLVIVGTDRISITGTLDAASHRAGTLGPGANAPACHAGVAATGAGGGAGGSLGGLGGHGGNATAVGGGGALPGATVLLVALQGGCAGSTGSAQAGGVPGPGGAGGGAVFLISTGTVAVDGTINASGAGGGGAIAGGGGGGGGSGGLIGLDAPAITGAGRVFANGGGGGGGARDTGAAGAGADPATPTLPATGGAGLCSNCGDGGNGAAGSTLAGMAGTTTGNSGGGGGGGAGVILVLPAQPLAASVSPPPR